MLTVHQKNRFGLFRPLVNTVHVQLGVFRAGDGQANGFKRVARQVLEALIGRAQDIDFMFSPLFEFPNCLYL